MSTSPSPCPAWFWHFLLRPTNATRCHLQGPAELPARLLASPGLITVQTHGELRVTGYLGRRNAGGLFADLFEATETFHMWCSHCSHWQMFVVAVVGSEVEDLKRESVLPHVSSNLIAWHSDLPCELSSLQRMIDMVFIYVSLQVR